MTPMASTLSICVCTSGRPDELARCLASVAAGSRLPAEVVVSDDSRQPEMAATIRALCDRYAFARYVEGPRRGLCANRNRVIRFARGDLLSLLDDDGAVGVAFVERAVALSAGRPRDVLTGDVLDYGTGAPRRLTPANPTFLGHFGRAIGQADRLENVNLNCNVFPRSAFSVAGFDESIRYGYEDTDLCAQLLAAGYRIAHEPSLVNEHRPPRRTDAELAGFVEQSERARFTMMVRRHLRWHRNLGRALAFAAVAPVHFAVTSVRRGRPSRALAGFAWLAVDAARALRGSAQPLPYGPESH